MKALPLLLLLLPGLLRAQSMPTSAPVGPKGPPRTPYLGAATSLPVEPTSIPATSLPVESTTLPASQPASLAAAEGVVVIASDVSVEDRASKPKAPDESVRLQGIWRSTRDPLGDYTLRGDLEEKSPRRARRLALALTLAGYGVLSLGGGSYYAREFGSGETKIPELFTSPISLALGAGLVIIGPSAGHIYAGEPLHAVRYSLRRLFGATLTGVGLSSAAFVLRVSDSQNNPIAGVLTAAGLAVSSVAIPGMWILGRGSIKEIRDAKYAALRHNTALKLQQTKISVQLTKTSLALTATTSW